MIKRGNMHYSYNCMSQQNSYFHSAPKKLNICEALEIDYSIWKLSRMFISYEGHVMHKCGNGICSIYTYAFLY